MLDFSRMDPILEISHITKDFTPPLSVLKMLRSGSGRGNATRALDDVSFTLPKGSVLAILGPNGAGKTTLLKILSTLILPDAGHVRVNGFVLGKDDEKIKSSIGLAASSERSFYWRLTGLQNLEFFAAMYGLDKAGTKTRIRELFDLFEITYQGNRFDSYSTGMQQKFGLMRALLHDPQILLLDEPTKSLDYASAVRLKDFVKDTLVVQQGKTVIFTTHQMDEAANFADVFMILRNGKIFGFGTLEDLKRIAGDNTASLGNIYVKLTQGGHS